MLRRSVFVGRKEIIGAAKFACFKQWWGSYWGFYDDG